MVGLPVRTPDAVMGVAFTAVFPLTFVSNAFVPIESMPSALQRVAACGTRSAWWSPPCGSCSATRRRRSRCRAGRSSTRCSPLISYCGVILAITIPLALRRYQARTSD